MRKVYNEVFWTVYMWKILSLRLKYSEGHPPDFLISQIGLQTKILEPVYWDVQDARHWIWWYRVKIWPKWPGQTSKLFGIGGI